MARGKSKRSFAGPFLALPMAMLHCPNFQMLSGSAIKLLLDIGSQYNGKNNGDLSAAWKLMKPKGWNSEATLNRAKKELIAAGFIAETRKGRLPNLCSLYGLTWHPLNPNQKLDCGPAGFPTGAWAQVRNERIRKSASSTSKTVAKVISIATETEVGNTPVTTEVGAISRKMAVL